MTTLYHHPRCSKSRAAAELLENRGIEFKVVKYLESPLSEKDLKKIINLLGIKPEQLARRGEKRFKEMGLGERELSDQEWLSIFASNPILIERPIVIHNGKAAIGRPLENITAILDESLS